MATAKKNNSAYTAAPAADKEKALATAIAQIERAYGKGSIMRMSDRPNMQVDAVPTGSLSLDLALGIGGLPRGRIIEIYGPESSGKTTVYSSSSLRSSSYPKTNSDTFDLSFVF